MNPFTEDYYMRGPETGLSNYVNYSWMPQQTRSFAKQLSHYLACKKGDTFLDFGCARGYVVRAMRELGVSAFGVDVSEWAVENCDSTVKPFIGHVPQHPQFDFVLAKDVLEHVPADRLEDTIQGLVDMTKKKLLFIVPLVRDPGMDYIRLEDRSDRTHVTRWTLDQWMMAACCAAGPGSLVTGSWCLPGLKPAAEREFKSTGFVLVLPRPNS